MHTLFMKASSTLDEFNAFYSTMGLKKLLHQHSWKDVIFQGEDGCEAGKGD